MLLYKSFTLKFLFYSIFIFEFILSKYVEIPAIYFEIQLFILYLFIILKTLRKKGIFNLFSIFLLTLALFSFMGIFISLFSDKVDYKDLSAHAITTERIPYNIFNESILVYIFFLITIYWSYNFFDKKNIRPESLLVKCNDISFNKFLYRVGRIVFWFSIIFTVYRSFLEFQLLRENRALLFMEGSANLGIPVFIRFMSTFLILGYYFIIASNPPKKIFILYSIFYFVPIIPSLMIGNRMLFAVYFLFLFWYLHKVYCQKFKTSLVLFWGCLIVILLQIIALMRDDIDSQFSIIGLITMFFVLQSTSFYLMPLYITYKDNLLYYHYPFIFDPLWGSVMGATGQSYEVLATRSGLGHQLIYTINPSYYLNGFSLGSSSVTELYEFGLLGVGLGAILFAWIINKIETMKINRYYLFFSFEIFYWIVSSPRNTYFFSLYNLMKLSLFAVFIYTFFYCLSLKKIKKNKC